jgi:hypothetical protein
VASRWSWVRYEINLIIIIIINLIQSNVSVARRMFGLLAEHGPWSVNSNGTLSHRPYAYNRLAHVVYIDSPAGVGFSYDTAPNPSTGDNQTMSDSHLALVQFFKNKFPEFAQNPLYISGESYGGHYVPQLSWKILVENSQAQRLSAQSRQHVCRQSVDRRHHRWRQHHRLGLQSRALLARRLQRRQHRVRSAHVLQEDARQAAAARLLPLAPAVNASRRVGSCNSAMNKVYSEITERHRSVRHLRLLLPQQAWLARLRRLRGDRRLPVQLKVRAALHVRTQYIQGPWSICTDVGYSAGVGQCGESVSVLISQLQQVMVFSGDVTFNCGFLGSERWIATLNMTKTSGWQAYYTPDKQVAGYWEQWVGAGMARSRLRRHWMPVTWFALSAGARISAV